MERDELPEGWEWRRLGDSCDIALGRTPSRSERRFWGGTNPWATIADLNEGQLYDTAEYITDAAVSETRSKPVPAGTLLMSFKLSIGKMAFAGRDLYTNEAIAALHILNPNELDNRYLYYALKTRTLDQDADEAVKGKTLNKAKLKLLEIPLPPLPEQQRIVARIEGFAKRANEALERLNKIAAEFDLLCRAILFDTTDGDPTPTPMRELVRPREPDISVNPREVYHFAGLKSFGRGVFKSVVKSGAQFAYPRLTRLQAGDFVYLKLMAWEGAFGIVLPEHDGFYVSPEYPVFEVNTARVLPEVLDIYFRSPAIWPTISEISTGTNARRKRLHPSTFLAFEFPLPPISQQHRVREIKRRTDELSQRHAAQRRELEGLMPSVLAKAFAGEL